MIDDTGIHDQIVRRLVERVFHQRLIGNVERGQYVEFMVEFALRKLKPGWRVTETWNTWDLKQADTGARIEVKQSAAAQNWPSPPSAGPPSFDIAPRKGYWRDDVEWEWVDANPPRRFADLYIFAYHPIPDPEPPPAPGVHARRDGIREAGRPVADPPADHRDPSQWEFYVVRERDLPDQKTLSLNPLRKLADRCRRAQLSAAHDGPASFDELPQRVEAALRGLDLKANAAPRPRLPEDAAT